MELTVFLILYLAIIAGTIYLLSELPRRKRKRRLDDVERMIARVDDAATRMRSERLSVRQQLHLRRIQEAVREWT